MSTEVAIASLTPDADVHAYPLERAMLNGGVLTQLEKAHFVAQMAHETMGFRAFEENLNYSAKRLLQVFPKYFKSLGQAEAYARNPVRIASRVYGGRYGNGDESTQDGWRFRGRGYIHLTFRDNYYQASEGLFNDGSVLVREPDLAMTPVIAAEIAVWYWNSRKCFEPARLDDLVTVTRRINGGLNGLADRRTWLQRTKTAFGVIG